MPKPTNIISHWYQLIENFDASSQEFYQAFESAVAARAVPQFHSSRVEYKEDGLASANREYLRIQRGTYAFDICAAPFGKGFFVSWWLTQPPLYLAFAYTIGFFFGLGLLMTFVSGVGFRIGRLLGGRDLGSLFESVFGIFGTLALCWAAGNVIRQSGGKLESTVLAMPLVGWLYARIFAPPTFYSLDTGLMFQESVHKAVLEVIDAMTAKKGVRALSESERRPIMKHFTAHNQE
jgi:hypothetical protein